MVFGDCKPSFRGGPSGPPLGSLAASPLLSPLPRTSLICFDSPDSIRLLKEDSSACDTLGRCFFNGLPMNSPLTVFGCCCVSGAALVVPAGADVAVGGVVEKVDDAGVAPVVLGLSRRELPASDAAEC